MQGRRATELTLVRHAPAISGGRLCGRTDVAADCGDAPRIAAVRAALGEPGAILVSPARRCLETARALWPALDAPATDPRLWEQDFGRWEGLPHDLVPDLGPLSAAALAEHVPPGGESFFLLCARVAPVLEAVRGGPDTIVVAHAGTVRAAIAMALGSAAAALAFDVAPLSITRLLALQGGGWLVRSVNWTPA